MIRNKILIAVSIISLIFSLAGCGGRQTSETDANAGLGSIVFTVPDGWTLTEFTPDSYSTYSSTDRRYALNIQKLSESALESVDPAYSDITLQEYFDQVCKASDEDIGKYDLEQEMIKICDSDAVYIKRKAENGNYLYLNATWIYNDAIYRLALADPSGVGADGTPNEAAVLLGSDEVALFEEIVASVAPGDGNAMQGETIPADSIGGFTYTVPAGYEVADLSDSFISMQNDNVILSISKTEVSDYTDLDISSEDAAAALEEEYSINAQDGESLTIAEHDGFISKHPDSDGRIRVCNAGFIADDALYIITMNASSYDSDGNPLGDAAALSNKDLSLFDDFLASFKVK